MPDSVLHTLPRTGEGRFSLVIGFRLRLRRHAKGTCDFLFRTFTNEDLPDDPHAICQRREGCEPYILRVCSWHFPPSGNPRSTAVQFRRGVHGVFKNAALLSGLSSVTPQGCVVGCYPAVCSFRTITSVLRRWERRGKTLRVQFYPIMAMTPRRVESRFSSHQTQPDMP